jgi:hypothetical protein
MSLDLSANDAVEQEIAFDMIRRALPMAPFWVGAAWLVWGVPGAVSAAFALVLVLANFALAATLLARAAKVSVTFLMTTAVVSYPVRLALLFVAVLAVHSQSWFAALPLGLTIIAAHLGLLFWETRFVSLSLAYPGLKPGAGRS